MKRYIIFYILCALACTNCGERVYYNEIVYYDEESNYFGKPLEECIQDISQGNLIYYTTSDNQKIDIDSTDFNASIISHTYTNGQWVIVFNHPITSIGDEAFRWCTSLTKVTIPDSVTKIGEWAFSSCTSLTSVTIGNSVTEIGNYAFYDCTSLTSVTSPDSVTKIGYEAFEDCTSLTRVTIGNSVTSIGDSAFSKCTSLTSVTIPNSVTSIGEYAFYGCTSLKAFYGKFASSDNRCLIVDGVLNSFAIGCGATEYTIPNSVTSIGNSAFRNCTSLTSVTIPDSVTSIEGGAFYGCTSLTSVYCKATTPPTGGYEAFSYYNNGNSKPIGCKIYVPRNSVAAYKSAEYWNAYADYIVGYDF